VSVRECPRCAELCLPDALVCRECGTRLLERSPLDYCEHEWRKPPREALDNRTGEPVFLVTSCVNCGASSFQKHPASTSPLSAVDELALLLMRAGCDPTTSTSVTPGRVGCAEDL
jgi:hypothetical protein